MCLQANGNQVFVSSIIYVHTCSHTANLYTCIHAQNACVHNHVYSRIVLLNYENGCSVFKCIHVYTKSVYIFCTYMYIVWMLICDPALQIKSQDMNF